MVGPRALRVAALVAASVVVSAVAPFAQERAVVIRGGTVLTGTGQTFAPGAVVFRGGTIEAVGPEAEVTVPDGAEVLDAEGGFVTPGYIDAYTHAGLDDAPLWERESLMAAARTMAPVLADPSESQWLRAGVTAIYVSPGPQNLVGGTGAVVKLTGKVLDESAGLSVSFGESALDAFAAPTTRQGMVGLLRQRLILALEDAVEGEEARAYARVLTESLPFRVLVNTPDDLLTALRLAEEFDLRLVLDSAAGGHVVAASIAEAGVPVVVGPSIVGIGDGGPYEAFAHTPANAARLHAAGVRIALSTGGFGRGRSVAMEALVAKAHGLPEEAALAAVTSEAAAILGVEDRVGAIEPGRDADLVIWDGRPISTWAETRRVIVDGEVVFSR